MSGPFTKEPYTREATPLGIGDSKKCAVDDVEAEASSHKKDTFNA